MNEFLQANAIFNQTTGDHELGTPESLGLPRKPLIAVLNALNDYLKGADTDRNRSRDPMFDRAEQAHHGLTRFLGPDAQKLLISTAHTDPASASPSSQRALWQTAEWMAQDIDSWKESEVSSVLLTLGRDRNAGWQLGPLLNAIVERFPDGHRLNEGARKLFRWYLEDAIMLANGAGVEPKRRRGPSRKLLFPQMISHLMGVGPRENENSKILEDLTQQDVRRLVEAKDSSLEQWMGLVELVGPWPELIPDLEHRLTGNTRALAAGALSHLKHKDALAVLVTTPSLHLPISQRIDALERYGELGLERLLEHAATTEGAPEWQSADSFAVQLLKEWRERDEDLWRSVTTEPRYQALRLRLDL